MTTEIFFKKQSANFDNIDTSKYTKIFINEIKEGRTTKLSLSKHKGDILYICSNKDLENVYDYFKIPETVKETNMPVMTQSNVKKSKQGNLFNLIKKKKV